MTDSIVIRPPRSTDQAYVTNSWVSCIVKDRKYRPQLANVIVDRLLDDPRTKLLIACEPQDSDKIVGWIAFASMPGTGVLEFVLVRHQWRNQGMAAHMMRAASLLGIPRIVHLFETADSRYIPKHESTTIVMMAPQEFLP